VKNLRTLDEYRSRNPMFDMEGYDKSKSGAFEFVINGEIYFAIASTGSGWDHVSVSNIDHTPSWDVMEAIKNKFFEANEFAVEFHPRREEYVNNMNTCLHLWRPNNNMSLPYPDIQKIKKQKPELVSKDIYIVDGKPYVSTVSKTDDYEFAIIQSAINKKPSWEVMCKIKQEIFGDNVALSYHGIQGDKLTKLTKNSQDSLLIFRPTKEKIITPPSSLVGIKGVTHEEMEQKTVSELIDMLENDIEEQSR